MMKPSTTWARMGECKARASTRRLRTTILRSSAASVPSPSPWPSPPVEGDCGGDGKCHGYLGIFQPPVDPADRCQTDEREEQQAQAAVGLQRRLRRRVGAGKVLAVGGAQGGDGIAEAAESAIRIADIQAFGIAQGDLL